MKAIKAFVRRGRAADVVHALVAAGFRQISLVDVKGTLEALSPADTDYSVEFGESVVTETKIEIVCDNAEVERAIEIFRKEGRSKGLSGWIYVSDIERGVAIDG